MVVFGQSICIQAKVGAFGQKCLYSGKVVVFRQSGSNRQNWVFRVKVVALGIKWFYSGKNDVIGQKWLYAGKVVVFRQK